MTGRKNCCPKLENIVFFNGIPNVPVSVVRTLWELENFTSNLFERQVLQMTLDRFFKNE
jgi:hypothetical protein